MLAVVIFYHAWQGRAFAVTAWQGRAFAVNSKFAERDFCTMTFPLLDTETASTSRAVQHEPRV